MHDKYWIANNLPLLKLTFKIEALVKNMSVQAKRKYFTVAEYHQMVQTGILSADDNTELIEGEIIHMSPIGSRHAACVKRLNAILNALIQQKAIISVQDPIQLSRFSEPEPDIALLRPRDDFYAQHHPTGADVLLIIEVADTSIDYDRDVKLPLYARSGIPEVWIVNLAANTVEAYSHPSIGEYQQTQTYANNDTINMPSLQFSIQVNTVVPE